MELYEKRSQINGQLMAINDELQGLSTKLNYLKEKLQAERVNALIEGKTPADSNADIEKLTAREQQLISDRGLHEAALERVGAEIAAQAPVDRQHAMQEHKAAFDALAPMLTQQLGLAARHLAKSCGQAPAMIDADRLVDLLKSKNQEQYDAGLAGKES